MDKKIKSVFKGEGIPESEIADKPSNEKLNNIVPNINNNLAPHEVFIESLCADPNDIENAVSVSLVKDFLELYSLMIIYAEAGIGKTMLTLSICVYLLKHTVIEKVYYCDFDNGIADQKNRGIHHLLREYKGRFFYTNLDTMDKKNVTPPMVLDGFIATANNIEKPYEKCFFVFDTLGELVEGSLSSDDVIRPLLDKLKKLRSMGATTQIIHHTTKSKEDNTFFGSNYIKIKIDALFHLEANKNAPKGKMEFALTCHKNRSGNLKDCAFVIDPNTHTLETGDYIMASMKSIEADFISKVKNILNEDVNSEIRQSELIEKTNVELGRNKSIELLQKYVGIMWKQRIVKFPKSIFYSIISEKSTKKEFET